MAGATVPFHNVKTPLEGDDAEHKNGWGFGYTKRKVFDAEKIAYIPSPNTYYGPWNSEFKSVKSYNKCTFGESYEKIKKRLEVENKNIIEP